MSDQDLIRGAFAGEVELAEARDAVMETIGRLDMGEVRVAEKAAGEWHVNEWVKEAILVYFQLTGMEEMDGGAVMWHDKIPTKRNLAEAQVRVVPPGVVRYGAYCEPGVIVMPGYVNIGAYVGSGTMVDTWATVGSCATTICCTKSGDLRSPAAWRRCAPTWRDSDASCARMRAALSTSSSSPVSVTGWRRVRGRQWWTDDGQPYRQREIEEI